MVNHAIDIVGTAISSMMVVYVVLWPILQTFNANPLQYLMRVWFQLLLYYAAFTMPWWALLVVAYGVQGTLPSWVALVLFLAAALYFYCTAVLPTQLTTHEQRIDLGLQAPLNIAVLSNLKVGIYSGKPRHIRRWVRRLNRLEVDAVVVTGDWLYHPGADLVGQLMLFKGLNKPIYTVMSRTDLVYQYMSLSAQGQPLLEDTLSAAFDALDITDISQQCVDMSSVLLCGWQDDEAIDLLSKRHKQGMDELSLQKRSGNTESLTQQIVHALKPVIVLAAHFDRVYELPKHGARPLVIAGDGRSVYGASNERQAISTAPIASRHPLLPRHQGVHQHELAQVYVAHDVGMSRWPFRLSKPAIDVLEIR